MDVRLELRRLVKDLFSDPYHQYVVLEVDGQHYTFTWRLDHGARLLLTADKPVDRRKVLGVQKQSLCDYSMQMPDDLAVVVQGFDAASVYWAAGSCVWVIQGVSNRRAKEEES
ncbi:MAG: hypothetical protein R3313_00505 [Candidatus Saccharimonadales bacterium]|nr:hypothetical protein [Candidatus Saccharimonadales bacterium]